jgi:hypothetical protein
VLLHLVQRDEDPIGIAEAYGVDPLDLVLANTHKPWQTLGDGSVTFADLYEAEPLYVPEPGDELAAVAALASMMGDVSEDDQIRAALEAAQLPPDQVKAAIAAHTGLSVNAQNAILDIIAGKKMSFSAIAPLVAAGLAATGVGAPIVAAVAATLPVLDAIAGIFAPGEEHCSWKVGALCIQAKQPYGPADPNWVTWEKFSAGMDLETPASQNAANGMVDAAYPLYRMTIGCELARMGQAKKVALGVAKPEDFLRAYYTAWHANAEYQLNGYTASDPYKLLLAVKEAWNRVHAPSATHTFTRTPLQNLHNQFCQPPEVTYVGALINGDVTGHSWPDLTINLGKASPYLTKMPGDGEGWSTGAKIAVAGGVTVGVLGLLWLLLGRPLTMHALKQAIAHIGKE